MMRDLERLARRDEFSPLSGVAAACSDECHGEFEGAGQCQGGPGADQSSDEAVAEAVCQVGAGSWR